MNENGGPLRGVARRDHGSRAVDNADSKEEAAVVSPIEAADQVATRVAVHDVLSVDRIGPGGIERTTHGL